MFVHCVDCFSIDLRNRLPGVWKLTLLDGSVDSFNLTVDDNLVQTKQQQQPNNSNNNNNNNNNNNVEANEILLKIQANGRFRQCDEGYQEGRWLSGRWQLLNHSSTVSPCNGNRTTLCLALDRQYFGPPHDRLMMGALTTTSEKEYSRLQQEDSPHAISGLSFRGSIQMGRFNSSKKDPAFFETEPLLISSETATGSFVLEQVLAFLRLLPEGSTLEDQGNNEESGFLVSGHLGSDESADDDDNTLFGCAFQ
jgi:hypothetical protein